MDVARVGEDFATERAKTEALMLGDIELLMESGHELRERRVLIPFTVLAQEVGAGGRRPGEANTRQPERAFEEPLVQFISQGLEPVANVVRVWRNDHELACSIDDLAGRRQAEFVEDAQGGQFGEQRDLKRASAEQLGCMLA